MIWVVATLLASAGQVARNAMQRQLTEKIGTVGATQVRFLYDFPFALLFLLFVRLGTGEAIPSPGAGFTGFLVLPAPWAMALGTVVLLASCAHSARQLLTLAPPESLPGPLKKVLARIDRARAKP